MKTQSGKVVANLLFLLIGLGSLLGAYAIYRVTQMPAKKRKKRRGGFRFVVRTKAATRGKMAVTVRLTGDVVARRSVDLRSEVEGMVRVIKLREGAAARRGQAIAYLQSIDQRLQVRKQSALHKQAQAMVLKARAELSRQRDLYRRTRQLRRSRTVSESDFIQARFRKEAAAAGLAESQAMVSLRLAELAIARRALSRTSIRAPFAGKIARLHVEAGKLVKRGDLIATLVGQRKVEARLFVPPRYINHVKVWMQVHVRIAGSKSAWLTAPLKRLLPTADANSRNRLGVVVLKAPPSEFLPGLPVEARVVIAEKTAALLVPKDALIRFGGAWVLYKVAKGRAQLVPVQFLHEQGGVVEIKGKVRAGDPVVTIGNEALFPNAPVSTGRRKRGKKQRRR